MKADGNEPTIRLQLDKALDLGEYTNTTPNTIAQGGNQSSSTTPQTKGTLTFDFDENATDTYNDDKRRSMSLKLASAKDGDKDVSLKGNLKVIGTFGGNGDTESETKATDNVQFKAELSGGVTGDVTLEKTFTSNIAFGKSSANDQNIEIGGILHLNGSGGSTTYASKHNVKMNGYKNTIKGGIKYGGTNGLSFANIELGKTGSILSSVSGGISSNSGTLNINFNGTTNTVQGGIRTDYNSTNNINFNGSTNTVTGKIFSWAGTNNITFKGNTNKIEKGTSDDFAIVSGNYGTSNLTFESGSNEIIGNITSTQDWRNGVINITFKEGTVTNTIKGEIGTNWDSTNNINFNGDTNTIEGKVNSWAGTNKIDFNGTTNTITGNVESGNHGTSNITFSNGQTNQIIGKVTTKTKATTEIKFNTANGGSSLLKGDILNGESNGSTSGSANNNGTTKISFKGNNSSMSLNGKLENKSGASTISFSGDNASMRITGEAQNTSASNSNGTLKISFSGNSSSMSIDKDVKTTGGSTEVSFTGNNSTMSLGGTLTNQNATTNLSISGNHSQMTIIGAIKSDGGNTNLSIKGDHLNIDVKALEVSNAGKMNVSFAGNNSTLRLRDAQHQITTLTTSSQTTNKQTTNAMNNMIDLSSNPNSSSFTLLEIGTKSTNAVAGGSGAQAGSGAGGSQAPAGRSADQAQTPAFSGNYNFKVYVDPNKQDGKLGNQTSQSNRDSSSTNYGNAYSDRVIIYEDTKEKSTQSLLVVVDPNDIRKIHYTEGKGTETAGNVAVATVKSTASSSTSSPNASATLTTSPNASNPQEPNSNIEFIAKEVINGGERIQVKLKKVATDEYGKVDSTSTSGASTDKGYITYFIDNAKSLGADPVTQKLVSSALSTNYDLYLANFNSLNKRMGELRNNPNNQGVWARIFGGAQESKFGVESQTQYVTVQSGYDYSLKFQEASNYVGFALSYAHSNGKSKKVTRANNVASNQPSGIDDIQSDGVEVAIYNSFVSDVGWYNDTIAKFSYLFSSFVLDQSPEKSKTTNYALTLSNEVGYRYVFGEKKDFYIDPQVELGFGYVNQSDFKSKLLTASGSYNNLTAIQNYLLVLRTRAGASLGKTIYGEKDRKVGLYLGAFYEYDFIDGGSNQISLGSGATTNLGSLTSNGRVILNLGSNIELNEKTRMYIDVEKSFGDKLRTHLQFNLGARYSF